MEEFADAVAAEGFVDAEGGTEIGCCFGYYGTHIAIEGAWFDYLLDARRRMGEDLEGWLVLDILGNSLLARGLLRLRFQQDKFH